MEEKKPFALIRFFRSLRQDWSEVIIPNMKKGIPIFFYAVTHPDQFFDEYQRMQQELAENSSTITMQANELRSMEGYHEQLKAAIELLAPKDLALDTLRELYISVRDTTYDYEKAGQYLLGHQWFARGYIQHAPVWDDIEKEIYRIALDQADILPYEQDFTAQDHLQKQAIEAIGEKLGASQIPASMPVARIDYLASNGAIRESLEYRDTGSFVSDVLHSNYYGEPMSITVYSDPKTGAHIDTSWRINLDSPPQGFQIEPYEAPAPAPEPTPEPEFELE